MKTMIKRGTVFALALLILAVSFIVPIRKAKAATTYNNTVSTNLTCSVDSNGTLHANLSVNGIKGKATVIRTDLYIEKRTLGVFWKRVDIGCTDNIWTDLVTSYYYDHIYTFDLSSTGTYRVTVTYTVSGSGGTADVITLTDTVTY